MKKFKKTNIQIFDVNNIQLKLQSFDTTVNSDLLNYIISHIEMLGSSFTRILKFELILKNEKDSQVNNCIAEVKVFLPGNVFFASDHCGSFKLAFKNVFEELNDQLMKFKID